MAGRREVDGTRVTIAKARAGPCSVRPLDILCLDLHGPGRLAGLRGIACVPMEEHQWFIIRGEGRLAR